MKNLLLKSFLGIFAGLNIVLFSYIVSFFVLLSDILWDVFHIPFDIMCVFIACAATTLLVVFVVYFLRHKDKKDVVETVEFDVPKDMTPVEVGFLIDSVVDDSDLSALLVYWASKGYIEIIEQKPTQKLKKSVEQLPNSCKNYEKVLFNKIFLSDKEIVVDKVAERLSADETVTNVIREVENSVGNTYFDKKVNTLRQIFICAFAFLFWFSVMYFRLEYFYDFIPIVEIFGLVSTILYLLCADWVLKHYDYRHKNNSSKKGVLSIVLFSLLMLVIAGLCVYFFMTDWYQVCILFVIVVLMFLVVILSRKMQIYSKKGVEQLGKILGLANFILVTESDRIKMLAEKDPKMFYDVLPYAFVLGISDKWIEKLDVIRQINPEIAKVNEIVAYKMFFSNRNFALVRAARLARTARVISVVSSASGGISLGRNGGGGGRRGGSNFGGIRRR